MKLVWKVQQLTLPQLKLLTATAGTDGKPTCNKKTALLHTQIEKGRRMPKKTNNKSQNCVTGAD